MKAIGLPQPGWIDWIEKPWKREVKDRMTAMNEITEYKVISILEHFSRKAPQKTVFVCEKDQITYEALRNRTLMLAESLKEMGVKRGDKVAIWGPNSIHWIIIQLAVACIGAVLVPINTRHRLTELEYTLKQSDSTTLFLAREFGPVNFVKIFEEACPEIENSQPGKLSSQKFPLLKNVISLGAWSHPAMFGFEDLVKQGEPNPSVATSTADDVVIIQYTSGTTGPPKGVMLTQGQTAKNAHCVAKRMELSEDDVILCSVPFAHSGGTILSTLLTLVAGARMIIQPYFDPEEAMEYIEKYKCTVFNGLETFFISIYEHPRFKDFNLSSLRTGWAPGPPEVLRSIMDKMGMKKICNLYGMSETSPNTSISLPTDPPELRATTCGKPHEGVEVKIIDPSSGKTVSSGQVGEICVRGWNVMQGYYRKPEETAKAIDADGWLHTGDLGVLNQEGYLTFKGRLKELIRVGGENVSPWEVENFILSHPAVKRVTVVGIRDERLVEVCGAVVQLNEGASCSPEEIIEFCRGKMASFKIPRRVIIVDEFPMTESGKIQKYKLKELFEAEDTMS